MLGETRSKSRLDKLFEEIKNIQAKNTCPKKEDIINHDIKTVAKQEYVKQSKQESSITKYNFIPEQEKPTYYIESDKKIKAILGYRKTLNDFVAMVSCVGEQLGYCSSKLSQADRELQDYLHELRMPKRNAYEGFKLYQLGHHLEVKRQGYKNAIDDIRMIANFASAHKDDIEKLKNIAAYVNSIYEERKDPIYMPRSDLNLPVGDKFRALPEEEQEKIRKNFEAKKKKKVS